MADRPRKAKPLRTVACWPSGSETRGACDETIPDSEWETLDAYGWGFVEAVPDYGSPAGIGSFYACPWHRSDCTDEERSDAIAKPRPHRPRPSYGGVIEHG
jgi:hypothetical protein